MSEYNVTYSGNGSWGGASSFDNFEDAESYALWNVTSPNDIATISWGPEGQRQHLDYHYESALARKREIVEQKRSRMRQVEQVRTMITNPATLGDAL